MVCIIYLLTNSNNSKVYVGQTWNPLDRRMGKDGSNYKNSIYLYAAIQKYGVDSFHYRVLKECHDQENADYWEEYYINEYDSRNQGVGYNLKQGGSHGLHSDETKAKISKNHSRHWLGKSVPDYMKQRVSEANSGKKLTPEHREKVIKTLQFGGFEGHHHSEEAKLKISQSCKGRKIDPEVVKKRSFARRMDSKREQDIIQAYKDRVIIDDIEKIFGTSRSSIYRLLKRNGIDIKKDFSGWTGKTHSEETKLKMSESRKKYWDEKKDKGQ